jgi:hypothetical protein
MGFHRVIKLMILFAFFVEVVNPTTTFVREQVNPVYAQKITKIEKKAPQQIEEPSDVQGSDSQNDEDYLSCSAVLPLNVFPPRPLSFVLSLALVTEVSIQEILQPIHRPPSLS